NLAELLKAARDKRPEIRAGAVGLFWKFRDQSKAIVPTALEALRDESPLVRRQAAWVLWNFGSEEAVVSALIRALKDNDVAKGPTETSVAEWAASSLSGAKVEVKAAVAALIDAIKADDDRVRFRAMQSLGWIGRRDKGLVPTIVPRLVELLGDKK